MESGRSKRIIFCAGIIFLIIMAWCGWVKLHYGFNFIDEGYHMTESWRLTQGDCFLDNGAGGPLMPYTVINSAIFAINPDITLLGLRKLQYALTLSALLVFGLSLFVFTKKYWPLPWVFSLFAFTGLDPTGMISNLSYYTYPHLFLVLHLAFLLFGLRAVNLNFRRMSFAASGFFLWAIGFSLLHLSVIAIAPILLFVLSKKFDFHSCNLSFSDLILILIPVAAGWFIFIGLHLQTLIPAVLGAVNFTLGTTSHSSGQLVHSLTGTGTYISICLLILAAFYFCAVKLNAWMAPAVSAALSILVYFIIETSCFGVVRPYYNGWFGRPMWFSGLLIAFIFLFWIVAAFRLFRKTSDQPFEFLIVIMVPVTILAVFMIFFSGLKALTALHVSIPAAVTISFFFISGTDNRSKPILTRFAVLVFLLLPFYYTTAWADWRFTYFDVSPVQASSEISQGFGKGIKTNPIYARLDGWIRDITEKFSDKDDFMISYIRSPMPHMIAKRRPSLDDTFVDFFSRSPEVYQEAIRIMKAERREPAIAFVFERMPVLLPVSLEEGTYRLPKNQFQFHDATDPVSSYIKDNMELAGEFVVSKKDEYVIRCYVRKGVKL